MRIFAAIFLNIGLYSVFPLYLTTINSHLRLTAFYIYISILLLWGGLAGAIYSFPISETIHISGGNLAYGAFMMSTVMLIIVEREMGTFRNMIRLVVTVDLFVFLGFKFLGWLLQSQQVSNPLNISETLFSISLQVLILGGFLILGEILLLLFIFLQVRKYLSNLFTLALIYTLAFMLILCVDGVLFPLFAFGISPELVNIMFGNISGKFIMAVCYSLPMLGFYLMFQRNFSRFLNTPLSMGELIHAPRGKLLEALYYYEMRDQQLERDRQKLTEIASRDELTALANRRKFDRAFEAEWTRCQRAGYPLTLVIGDIDFFKQYNDNYGHPQGDVCLQKVAFLWGNIFKRPTDLAARIGGEEFAILLPNTTSEQIRSRLENFLKQLHEQPIPHRASSVAPHVTMSIGVAGCIPNPDSSPKELFEIADRRLYAAKQGGRNRVVVE